MPVLQHMVMHYSALWHAVLEKKWFLITSSFLVVDQNAEFESLFLSTVLLIFRYVF